ncbi:GNAT family N-acetyltransferase [Photobacterium sanguinicancri]|uniref:GNAT family protein n=1 Tax=Photobacterium sanguinicancri TaxID=875932 RepID=A0AAW7XYY5_9GAMM|nr:GNAT family protein [Photobacterium sanguinicancri]MDO6541359.1 GNAT family protein [Photobacterium sanguinicancri]
MFTKKVDDELELVLVHPALAMKYATVVEANRDYLSQWMAWAPHVKTEDDFKAFVKNSLLDYANGKSMVCAIEYQGVLVGNIAFNTIKPELKMVEIGYWLDARYQGRGIMTRCCQAMIDIAFNHLKVEKVQISAAKDNYSSRGVCERLGMNLEGVITNKEVVSGRILDHAVYGLHKPK